jgi:hypothetical protein
MFESFLIPENTIVTAKGDGQPVDISAADSRTFLLTLNITRIVEQESLDVSVFGSADGQAFVSKPLIAFPQKFYAGQHPLLLDLTEQPDIKFLRAHWDVNRWGRGSETPMFELSFSIKEVPPEILREASADAKARR